METPPPLPPLSPVMEVVDSQVCVKVEKDPDKDAQSVKEAEDSNENIDTQACVSGKKRSATKRIVNKTGGKRPRYDEEDDLEILAYLEMNGGFPLRKGYSIWKKMEEEQIVPGRTWESLRSRCNNILIPTFFQPDELPELEPDPDEEELPKQIRYLKTALPIPKELGISEEEKLHPLHAMQKHSIKQSDDTLVTFVQNRGQLYETKNENQTGMLDVVPIPKPKKKKKVERKLLHTRKHYTAEEDAILEQFVKENGVYEARKGIGVWELMEKLNVVPDRTWASMKQRCNKAIFPKMSQNDLKKRIKDSELPEFRNLQINRMPPVYTIEEDNEIVRYIADHEYYNEVYTLKLWKKLAKRGTIGKRGFKSLSDRYRRILRYRIRMGFYDLTHEERCLFPKPD